jgi:hypothetical protein
MSFTDRLVLWLHIGFAIFTVGPVALAISSTPRYIRRRDVPVLRYLTRITMIFTIGSLLVLVFGVILGQLDHDFAHPWLTAAMTLFVVALALLVLIIRDQRRAVKALAPGPFTPAGTAGGGSASAGSSDVPETDPATAGAGAGPVGPAGAAGAAGPAAEPGAAVGSAEGSAQPVAGGATLAADIASVEGGRIAAMGGVVNLIWLVILVLMVWQP